MDDSLPDTPALELTAAPAGASAEDALQLGPADLPPAPPATDDDPFAMHLPASKAAAPVKPLKPAKPVTPEANDSVVAALMGRPIAKTNKPAPAKSAEKPAAPAAPVETPLVLQPRPVVDDSPIDCGVSMIDAAPTLSIESSISGLLILPDAAAADVPVIAAPLHTPPAEATPVTGLEPAVLESPLAVLSGVQAVTEPFSMATVVATAPAPGATPHATAEAVDAGRQIAGVGAESTASALKPNPSKAAPESFANVSAVEFTTDPTPASTPNRPAALQRPVLPVAPIWPTPTVPAPPAPKARRPAAPISPTRPARPTSPIDASAAAPAAAESFEGSDRLRAESERVDTASVIEAEPPAGPSGAWWTIPLTFLGIAIVACAILIPAADENRRDAYELAKIERDVAYFQKQSEVNQDFLRRVNTDPTLAERLALRQLHQTREGVRLAPLASRPDRFGASPYAMTRLDPPAALAPYRPVPGKLTDWFLGDKNPQQMAGLGLILAGAGVLLGGRGRRQAAAA
ncbi:MAG TPA: hypothetical protein VF595_12505 [Tepidisphaeraceae bacterium]|jgi:hypothetical protein